MGDKNKHCKKILKFVSLIVEYLENLNFMCLMRAYLWHLKFSNLGFVVKSILMFPIQVLAVK
jgi:hypothetical protein